MVNMVALRGASIFVFLFVQAFTVSSNAQCTDNITYSKVQCAFGTTCKETVTVGRPSGRGDTIAYSCSSTSCCQQLLTDCFSEGECFPFPLKTAEMQARLSEIAATSKVLVADCKGRYTSYERLRSDAPEHGSELANDHVLR